MNELHQNMGIFERLEQRLCRVELLLEEVLKQRSKDTTSDLETLTVKQVAQLLKVDKRTVERWLQLGQLTRIKAGRSARIAESEITAIIRGEKVIGG